MAPCVLTAEFTHETNTFNVIKADYEAFRSSRILEGDDAISARGDANTELAGFLDVARKYQWDLVHAISADAEPAGPVTRDAFDRITHEILAKAAALGDKLDGILLGLHGAMVTDFSSDGEGEVLERLRRVLKRRIPIAVTLDPHANVTATMCENADVLIPFKTYPHVDIRETARHAAELLHKAIQVPSDPRLFWCAREHERKMDPRFGGPPSQVEAKLLRLSDGKLVGTGPQLGGLLFSFGLTAVISVGGVKVLVVTERSQLLDQEQFRAFGIEPTAHDVIVVKSQQHFRADFESIAGEIIVCACGALSTMDYAKLPFRNVPRPIYPLDKCSARTRTIPSAGTM